MNLNKYTKAELISKFNKLESKTKDSNSTFFKIIWSYLDQILKLLITVKDILIKLTFIHIFLQFFSKFKIFRRIWFLFETIVLTIFGINLLDNFGMDFIANLFGEIRTVASNIIDYLSNTSFYNFLNKLFSKNEIIEQKEEDVTKTGEMKTRMSKEYPKNQWEAKEGSESVRQDYKNSRISEWLKPHEEIKEEINEITNKAEGTSYKKYFIIGGVIIAASLAWVYSDEIRTGSVAIWDWLVSFRGRTTGDGGGSTDSNPTPTRTNFQISNSEPSSSDIESINKSTEVLTSPSLEDLNKHANEDWAEKLEIRGTKRPLLKDRLAQFMKDKPDQFASDMGIEKDKAEKIIHDLKNIGKSKELSAWPSSSKTQLENLETLESLDVPSSPTESTSSTDTIKPATPTTSIHEKIKESLSNYFMSPEVIDFRKKLSELSFEDESIPSVIDKNWKNLLPKDTADAIEYVEKHFPKSELEDSDYVKRLIKEVSDYTRKFTKEFAANGDHFSERDLQLSLALGTKNKLWLEHMEEKLKQFD